MAAIRSKNACETVAKRSHLGVVTAGHQAKQAAPSAEQKHYYPAGRDGGRGFVYPVPEAGQREHQLQQHGDHGGDQ